MELKTRDQFPSYSYYFARLNKELRFLVTLTASTVLLLICLVKLSFCAPIEELGSVLLTSPGTTSSNIARITWDKTYGGLPGDEGGEPSYSALIVIQTADGGYALAGLTDPTEVTTVWVVKVDKAGRKQWDIEFNNILGTTDISEQAISLIQTKDNGFVIAGSKRLGDPQKYDYWVAKLNQSGSTEWEKTYHERDRNKTYLISQTADGGYLLAGDSYPRELNRRVFSIMKITPKGDKEWIRPIGEPDEKNSGNKAPNAIIPTAILLTKTGEYILAGRIEPEHRVGQAVKTTDLSGDFSLAKLSNNGSIIWEKHFPAYTKPDSSSHYYMPCEIVQTADGGYAVLRWIPLNGILTKEYIMTKVSPGGLKEWEYTFESFNDVKSLLPTTDGGCIVSGRKSAFNTWEATGWIMKLSKTGSKEWDQTFHKKGSRKVISSVAQTPDGGLALAGQSDYRAWLIKLDLRNK